MSGRPKRNHIFQVQFIVVKLFLASLQLIQPCFVLVQQRRNTLELLAHLQEFRLQLGQPLFAGLLPFFHLSCPESSLFSLSAKANKLFLQAFLLLAYNFQLGLQMLFPLLGRYDQVFFLRQILLQGRQLHAHFFPGCFPLQQPLPLLAGRAAGIQSSADDFSVKGNYFMAVICCHCQFSSQGEIFCNQHVSQEHGYYWLHLGRTQDQFIGPTQNGQVKIIFSSPPGLGAGRCDWNKCCPASFMRF